MSKGQKITDETIAADPFLRAAVGPVVARGRAMHPRALPDAFDAYMRGLFVGGGRRRGATDRDREFRLATMRYHLRKRPGTTAREFSSLWWPSVDSKRKHHAVRVLGGRREYRISLITAKRDLAQIRRDE